MILHNNAKPDILIVLFFSLIPFQWIQIISVGGFSLKVAHVPMILVMLAVATRPRLVLNFNLAAHTYYMLSFSTIVLLAISLMWSDSRLDGLNFITRQFFYFCLSICASLWLITIQPATLIKSASLSMFVAVPAFLAILVEHIVSQNINLLNLVQEASRTSRPEYIQYHLFVRLFNESTGLENANIVVSAANRHGVLLSLMTTCIFYLVGRSKLRQTRLRQLGDLLAIVFASILLISVSRSALLVSIICVTILLTGNLLRRGVRFFHIIATLLAIFAIFAILNLQQLNSIREIGSDKFISDVLENPRVYEYLNVIERIGDSPALGAGAGTPIQLDQGDAQYVHNHALHYWHQAGFIGLVLSISMFLYLVSVLHRSLIKASRTPIAILSDMLVLVSCFCVFPLVRMAVAKSGALSVSEWTAIAVMSALVVHIKHLESFPKRTEHRHTLVDRFNDPEGALSRRFHPQ